jgi:hypothetical protein
MGRREFTVEEITQALAKALVMRRVAWTEGHHGMFIRKIRE